MQTLAKQVLEHATGVPEGTPLVAKELLHLGAALHQAGQHLVYGCAIAQMQQFFGDQRGAFRHSGGVF